MMGCGKSSVGRAIAAKTGREFVDTDLLVQNRIGRPIRQFFSIYGETAFRDFETATLREMAPARAILATGGGIVLRDENWVELRRLGPTFYLRASPETLQERLQVTRMKRPLLQDDDWKDKLESILIGRESVYEKADFVVDVDRLTIEEVADTIVTLGGGCDE